MRSLSDLFQPTPISRSLDRYEGVKRVTFYLSGCHGGEYASSTGAIKSIMEKLLPFLRQTFFLAKFQAKTCDMTCPLVYWGD